MQNQQKNSQTMWIVLIVLVVGGAAYFFFQGKEPEPSQNLTAIAPDGTPLANGEEAPGSDLLPILNQLNAIKFDTKFFEDRVFASLVDRTVEITKEPVGRHNPFAPLTYVAEVTDSSGLTAAVPATTKTTKTTKTKK